MANPSVKQPNPITYLFRYMWRFSKGNRHHVVFFMILSFFANGLIMLEPLLVARILNVIQQEGVTEANLREILLLLSLFIGIAVGFWLFHGPSRVMETRNAFLMRLNYRQYLLHGVLALPADWHADHHSGDTIGKVEKGADGLYRFAEEFFELIDLSVRFTAAVIALSYFDLRSGIMVSVAIVATMALIVNYDKILLRQLRQLHLADNAISAKVYDVISNVTTVIILRIQKLVLSDILQTMRKPLKLFVRHQQLSELKWFLVTLASYLMIVVVLGTYLWGSVASGTVVLIGTVYALYEYLQRASEGFYRFAYIYGVRVREKSQVLNAEQLSDNFSETTEVSQVSLGTDWKELEVRNCEFSYHGEVGEDSQDDGEAEVHIDNISFTIRQGEKVAFVGESGSGKTTMLKLMRGLYQPQQATVLIDGQELPNGFLSISDSIALIPQDPEIFTATIKDNITMEVEQSMEKVLYYSDLAQFAAVAEQLPHGYDSSIVEKGVNLSGGEKQRLALARGLFASEDKAIVLLDEPTSSVDAQNELLIYKNIFSEFPEKSMISSIHRLHLLSLFDRVILFSDGKIVADGTFAEVQEQSELFQKLWRNYKDSAAAA